MSRSACAHASRTRDRFRSRSQSRRVAVIRISCERGKSFSPENLRPQLPKVTRGTWFQPAKIMLADAGPHNSPLATRQDLSTQARYALGRVGVMQIGHRPWSEDVKLNKSPTTKNLGDISCETALALCCEPCEISRDLTVGLLLVWDKLIGAIVQTTLSTPRKIH